MTSMLNPEQEQAAIGFDQAASMAKTRICQVMKHTPPRPPQQQLQKLPPMDTIAQNKP